MILVDASGITATRPDKPLFTNLSLTIADGDRLGVLGINGCGKSTLLRILAGVSEPEAGVVRRGRGVRIVVLDQEAVLTAGPVREAVTAGVDAAKAWEAESILGHLGMDGLLDADVATLSGGQAKRVALGRALLQEADLLVLDEPTNHLDLDAIGWLEERLARWRGGLLLVTHDRHVLDRACTKVLELDRGTGYLHDGGYQGYLEGRQAREERNAASESTRQNLARKELAWLRRGAPARTRKPKAHIESATAIVNGRAQAAARSGALGFGAATSRSGEGEKGPGQGSFRASADESLAPRLGTKVIELEGVGHRFEARESGVPDAWLFRRLNWILDPGGRYGIVGPNGTGKSTLLDVLAGRMVPEEGTVGVGPTVRLSYSDQLGRALDPNQRVREAVAGPTRPVGTPEDKRLMEQFWFEDDAQFAPISTLSGGERRRLQLLLVLAERPNVLLLDEPTNDLDLDTLRALEDFLDEWPGTLVVVSHDRSFMDRTVEDVLAIDHGRAALVAGGYAGWRALRDAGGSGGPAAARSPLRGPVRAAGGGAVAVAEAPKKRSSSTLRHLLKNTERDVAKATKDRERMSAELDVAVAARDGVAIGTLGHALADAQARLDAAEERWLELAAEAEG